MKHNLQYYPSCLLIPIFRLIADVEELGCPCCIDCEVMCSKGWDEIFLNLEVCVCYACEFMSCFGRFHVFMEGFHTWMTLSCYIVNLSVVPGNCMYFFVNCCSVFSVGECLAGIKSEPCEIFLSCSVHMCCLYCRRSWSVLQFYAEIAHPECTFDTALYSLCCVMSQSLATKFYNVNVHRTIIAL